MTQAHAGQDLSCGRLTGAIVCAGLLAVLSACSDPGVVGPPDGQVPADAAVGPDAAPPCQGDNNGVIAEAELPFVPGAEVAYLVNAPGTEVPVAPDGVVGGDGERMWDFTDTSGQAWTVRLAPTSGAWYESAFPTAHYAAPLSPQGDVLGIYRVADHAVWFLGLASAEPDRTRAPYDEPVPLIRFPVAVGPEVVTYVAHVTDAVLAGQPYAATDTYRISVDQRGTAVLPYLALPNTLRLHVEVHTSLPGGQTVHQIQYLYLHECWGEVARIVSRPGELDPSFGTASEFRRLALP